MRTSTFKRAVDKAEDSAEDTAESKHRTKIRQMGLHKVYFKAVQFHATKLTKTHSYQLTERFWKWLISLEKNYGIL